MHTTHLRKVGGSVMLAVPPAMLDMLHLHSGSTVSLEADNGQLIMKPTPAVRYTLDELLAQCDPHAPFTAEDFAWINTKSVGGEL